MVRPSGTEAPGARRCGQADLYHELRARVVSWPPLATRPVAPRARIRRCRVARRSRHRHFDREAYMRRVVGMDIHRTFGEVVIWENGVLRHAGRVDMTLSALEGLGNRLAATDEVVMRLPGTAWRSRAYCRGSLHG